ncbi:MAG: hypothetical protein DRP79_05520 [Planctomycetota bacterium]|nr:MAG: hypothetical protein DRP79_05520 [Planctomycetota bacterium]
MSKKNRKRHHTATRKQQELEELDRERRENERALRNAIAISAVIYAGVWILILVIVWGNGWFGPAT